MVYGKKKAEDLAGTSAFLSAPRAGLEPATLRLTVACSTIELPRKVHRQILIFADGQIIYTVFF